MSSKPESDRRALVAAVALSALALAPGLAWAQQAPAQAQSQPAKPRPKPPAARPKPKPKPAAEDADDDESTEVSAVTIQGRRAPPPPPGSVVGDIKPELTLSPADLQSYGVSTVTELLNELAPETRSDHGRSQTAPVILLNGRRISSLNEVQNIPTEAILRIDILPEEVSLKYGYTADQRVVNIVLKRYFRALTGEVVGGATTEGGDATGQAEVDRFQVRRDTRTNLDLKYQVAAGLTDAQRGLSETAGAEPYSLAGNVESATAGAPIDPDFSALVGTPVTVASVPAGVTASQRLSLADFLPTAGVASATDTAADHSLVPRTQALTANVVVARPVFAGFNATLNATLGGTTSTALQGLPGIELTVPAGDPFSPFSQPVSVYRYVAGAAPLTQTIDGWTGHLGVTLNRDLGPWRLSLTSAYNHADTTTVTGVGLDASALQSLISAGSASVNPFGPLPTAMLGALPVSTARSITDGGNFQVLVNGPLVKLPAGPIYMSGKLGDVEALAQSSSDAKGLSQVQSLSRNDAQGQLNVDFPLTSRKDHVFGALGDFSANVNTAVDQLSDFGPLVTLGYGLNWTFVPGYNLIVSETHDHQAPTLQQLDGPVVETPGVRLFDYSTGQTVTVTQITGGDRALQADNRHVWKIGVTFKPFPTQNFTFTANYIDSVIANPIESFPAASAALEAAFPGRFVRNSQGQLVEEDNRLINFASQQRTELRWGINFSMPVGKQPQGPTEDEREAFARRRAAALAARAAALAAQAQAEAALGVQPGAGAIQQNPGAGGQPNGQPPGQRNIGGGGMDSGTDAVAGVTGVQTAGQPSADDNEASPGAGLAGVVASAHGAHGGGGGFGGGGGGGGGGFGGGGGGRGGGGGGGFGGGGGQPVGGRFQFAIYHTVYFKDQFLVQRGGPVLDLLDGAAAGSTGGQYRHEVEAQFGYTDNGYGARLSADWRSATVVDGGSSDGAGQLDFSDVTTVNLRLWDDFSPQKAVTSRLPFLNGVRVTFNVTNLFNQSVNVRNTAGPTPAIYQTAYQDPTGRVVSINLRKILY